MKTKIINYETLTTTYNGEVFKHGEVLYAPTTGHDDMTNAEVNFRLAVKNDSVCDFTDELSVLLAKYAQ
jgi:hypothetical protein